MVYFTMLVIGENVEEQLDPYHCFSVTERDDQYVKDVDITAGVLSEMRIFEDLNDNVVSTPTAEVPVGILEALGNFGLENCIVEDESEVEKEGLHKFGYAVVKNGTLVKAVERTNPNEEWDHWVRVQANRVFKFKGVIDEHCTCVKKGDVDFPRMEQETARCAAADWEIVRKLAGKKPWKSWEEISLEVCGSSEARCDLEHWPKVQRLYWDQPGIKLVSSSRLLNYRNWDTFLLEKEEFVNARRFGCMKIYGVVENGVWKDKGDMEVFNMHYGSLFEMNWNAEVLQRVKALPDETKFTVVSCHM